MWIEGVKSLFVFQLWMDIVGLSSPPISCISLGVMQLNLKFLTPYFRIQP